MDLMLTFNLMLSPEDHALFKAYYQTETKYYIDRLEKYLNGQSHSFNIKALLISYLYLCYRKMFKWAGIFFLISFAISIIQSIFLSGLIDNFVSYNTSIAIEKVIDLVFFVVIGAYTNRLYLEQSIRDIDRIKKQTSDHEERLRLAAKKGGVNWVVPFALIVFLISIWAIVANP